MNYNAIVFLFWFYLEVIMFLSPVAMHIPDGFLSVAVSLICWVVAIAIVAIALRQTNHILGERQVPLMGVLAAAIFAGQMLNFSVTGGTRAICWAQPWRPSCLVRGRLCWS